MKLLDEAIRFAAERHAGQVRDGNDPLPYIVHPVEVVANLRHIGGVTDPELLAAAALHDVLEETATKEAELTKLFGNRVCELVMAVTRCEPTAEETKGMDPDQIWALRSEILLAEIRAMSPEPMQIKLADRLSNLRESKRTRGPKKQARYEKQTKWLLKAIPRDVNHALWDAVKAELS